MSLKAYPMVYYCLHDIVNMLEEELELENLYQTTKDALGISWDPGVGMRVACINEQLEGSTDELHTLILRHLKTKVGNEVINVMVLR